MQVLERMLIKNDWGCHKHHHPTLGAMAKTNIFLLIRKRSATRGALG